ncbi:unnamed protein product, partial [Ilex paraguariensis]
MANSRIARFVTEVAPPQFVSVMRYRDSKMLLDTINEEEREVSTNDSLSLSPKCLASSSSTSSYSKTTSKNFLMG